MSKTDTDRKLYNQIMKALRNVSYKSPTRYKVLQKAFAFRGASPLTKRMNSWYFCNDCGESFMKNQINVDHINPIVPVTGFVSWDDTIDRMFCDESGLQVLCKGCHTKKSIGENAQRPRNPARKKKAVPRMKPSRLRNKRQ